MTINTSDYFTEWILELPEGVDIVRCCRLDEEFKGTEDSLAKRMVYFRLSKPIRAVSADGQNVTFELQPVHRI